jgi:hypothetical protein
MSELLVHNEGGRQEEAEAGRAARHGGVGGKQAATPAVIQYNIAQCRTVIWHYTSHHLATYSTEHGGARGLAKYRDSENLKAVPLVFYGVKITPLPLPVLCRPRAAVPCGVAQPAPGA